MKTIFAYDPWRLVENELHKDDMRLSESMTSIGNGHMGMRGNFEERYSRATAIAAPTWRASGSRIKRAWAGGKTATRSISARSSMR